MIIIENIFKTYIFSFIVNGTTLGFCRLVHCICGKIVSDLDYRWISGMMTESLELIYK